MDKPRLLESLNLSSETSIYLLHLQLILWGRGLNFTCQAQTPERTKHHFSLEFADCRDMRWQAYSHIAPDDTIQFPLTELVNFHMGRNQHRSPCHILTEHFGLRLFYGELKILPINP